MGKKKSIGFALEEGFANPSTLSNDTCYDEFYAKVYDPMVQPTARAAIEVKTPIEQLEKMGKPRKDIRVADIGCGTGVHVEFFANEGIHSVVGYDKSPAMIAECKRRFERDFKVGDVTDSNMAAADQFDLITMYYFTLYLIEERNKALRNIYLWLAPGGVFCVHIVNKLKFDPILEAASPFVGFSVQKYSDKRVTKSNITFEEFDYTGDFQLNGSRAIYEEIFKFKNGNVRRHEQQVWMPNIEPMVEEIESVGFKLLDHIDMTPIGYEYQYLFMFAK
jgi:SAM-dependent methyltransferase